MQLYFFHLCDGEDVLLDPDGVHLEVADLERAALREARSIISADALAGIIRLDERIDVFDEAGALVHRLEFGDAIAIIPRKV
jgi:hypothetical protein